MMSFGVHNRTLGEILLILIFQSQRLIVRLGEITFHLCTVNKT